MVLGAVAGVVLPLLQQTILLWQVSLGYLVLGKKLSPWEVRNSLVTHRPFCLRHVPPTTHSFWSCVPRLGQSASWPPMCHN